MIVLMQEKVYSRSIAREELENELDCQFIFATRFNLFIQRFRDILDEKGIPYQDWLSEKINSFVRYCYPSVKKQSKSNFKWLIFFDREEQNLTSSLAKSFAADSRIVPVFLERGLDHKVQMASEIHRIALASSKTFALTFRLDCDDAINRHFLKNVDAFLKVSGLLVADTKSCVLSFPFGAQCNGADVHLLTYPMNPFIGLLEPSHTLAFDGPYSFNHGLAYHNRDISHMFTRQPMWLQMLERANVMNSLYGASVGPLPLSTISGAFACDWENTNV